MMPYVTDVGPALDDDIFLIVFLITTPEHKVCTSLYSVTGENNFINIECHSGISKSRVRFKIIYFENILHTQLMRRHISGA